LNTGNSDDADLSRDEARAEMIAELIILITERDNIRALGHELAAKKERLDELILSDSTLELAHLVNYVKSMAALSDYRVQYDVYTDRVQRLMEKLKP
jgi:hypothetical protein